jgi:hypothetical protein
LPVVGRILQYFTWLRYSRQHQTEVLDPIAEQIINQLESRPALSEWPVSPHDRQVAMIISDAITQEKGLTKSPALHPDDPFPLLFWGPFDDLTPLIVRANCRDQLKLTLPTDIFTDAWQQRWTIQRFISHCTDQATQSKTRVG